MKKKTLALLCSIVLLLASCAGITWAAGGAADNHYAYVSERGGNAGDGLRYDLSSILTEKGADSAYLRNIDDKTNGRYFFSSRMKLADAGATAYVRVRIASNDGAVALYVSEAPKKFAITDSWTALVKNDTPTYYCIHHDSSKYGITSANLDKVTEAWLYIEVFEDEACKVPYTGAYYVDDAAIWWGAASSSTTEMGTNLLQNGDFETAGSIPAKADHTAGQAGWYVSGGSAAIVDKDAGGSSSGGSSSSEPDTPGIERPYQEVTYTGKTITPDPSADYAAFVSGRGEGAGDGIRYDLTGVLTEQDASGAYLRNIDDSANGRYFFNGRMKLADADATAYVRVRIASNDGAVALYVSEAPKKFTVTGDWTALAKDSTPTYYCIHHDSSKYGITSANLDRVTNAWLYIEVFEDADCKVPYTGDYYLDDVAVWWGAKASSTTELGANLLTDGDFQENADKPTYYTDATPYSRLFYAHEAAVTTVAMETGGQTEDYPYGYLALTPGADSTKLNLNWYTPQTDREGDLVIRPLSDKEAAYLDADNRGLLTTVDGQTVRYADNKAQIRYTLPLDAAASAGHLLLDISGNYVVELSADGVTYQKAANAAGWETAAKTDTSNREQLAFPLDSYLKGAGSKLYVRITDQTPENRWGAVLRSVVVTYQPLTGMDDTAVVQYAKASDSADGSFPADKAITIQASRINASFGYLSNKATLTGLSENTTYLYRIGNRTADEWSEVKTYTTRGGKDYTFILTGDPQIGASEDIPADTLAWNKTLDAALQRAPDAAFLLSAGDQVDSHSNEFQYEGLLSSSVWDSLPMAPTIGNHDTSSKYFTYHFNVPNPTKDNVTAAGGNYTFQYGETLFVVLNGNADDGDGFRRTFAAATAACPDYRWLVVCLHQDIYGSGTHTTTKELQDLRATLFPILDEYMADIVLTGHDHSYTRAYILRGDEKAVVRQNAAGEAMYPFGTLYITAGSSSGSKYYPLVGDDIEYVDISLQPGEPTYSLVQVSHDALTIATYRTASGDVVDTYTLTKVIDASVLRDAVGQAEELLAGTHPSDASWALLEQRLAVAKPLLTNEAAEAAQLYDAVRGLRLAIVGLSAQEFPAPPDSSAAPEPDPSGTPDTGEAGPAGAVIVLLLAGAVSLAARRRSQRRP